MVKKTKHAPQVKGVVQTKPVSIYKGVHTSYSYYILLGCTLVAALATQRLESWAAKITVVVVCCSIIVGTVYFTARSVRGDNIGVPKWVPPSTIPPGLVQSNWCKSAIIQTSTAPCCMIFDYVTKLQIDRCEPWGTILDAGTGNHSLSWIVDLPGCSAWTAITGSESRAKAMKAEFKHKIRDSDEILFGNWIDKQMLEGRVFDVVVADYLLGSIDGFAPYFQDQLFERLKPHVGKVLYFVGMDPLPEKADTLQGQLIIQIAKLRDACILLAGHRMYREYPMDWSLKHLARAGFRVTNVANFETVQTEEFVEAQLNVAQDKLVFFKDKDLAKHMKAHIEDLRAKIYSMKWGITFGGDHVISAVVQ